MAFISIMAGASLLMAGPAGHFTTEQAADCAAIQAITLDAMRAASNVPAPIRLKVRNGLAMWEYELSASAEGAPPEKLQKAADSAIAKVHEEMPQGQGADAAAARGEYLTSRSAACATLIAEAYGEQEHPVMPYLREADAKAGLPAVTPVSASAADDKSRGLR